MKLLRQGGGGGGGRGGRGKEEEEEYRCHSARMLRYGLRTILYHGDDDDDNRYVVVLVNLKPGRKWK